MRSIDKNTNIDEVDLNRLLEVSTAQIGSILKEGNQSIDELTQEFSQLAQSLQELRPKVVNRNDDIEDINVHLDELSLNVNKILVSFQFYDRLTQRLQHVIHGIDIISSGIESRGCAGDWEDLYHKIRDSYTLSEEQSIFEVMMGKKDSYLIKNNSNKQKVELF